MKSTPKTAPAKAGSPQRRSFGAWLVRNLALFVAAYVVLTLLGQSESLQWLKEGYFKQNLEITKMYSDATYDQRMEMKLGADYQYLIYLRDNTPANAVIFYPTREDFVATLPGEEKSPFSGQLFNKLSAVRVLYPRKVILADEWGKTSWSKRTNYVAIVNGRNLDKVGYPVDSTFTIGVLPVKRPKP
jgi:hypothetical protein